MRFRCGARQVHAGRGHLLGELLLFKMLCSAFQSTSIPIKESETLFMIIVLCSGVATRYQTTVNRVEPHWNASSYLEVTNQNPLSPLQDLHNLPKSSSSQLMAVIPS